MSDSRRASVIVRTKNSARTLPATLDALATQSVRPQVIVVDSGSTDGTLDVAARYAAEVVHLAAQDFSYGRALNVGAARSVAPVHFALSAHALPPDSGWVDRHLRHYEDPSVGAVSGEYWLPGGEERLRGVYRQSGGSASRQLRWGFSNTAASWRALAWREHPFREDLQAAEDKEWSWRLLDSGWTLVFDSALHVPLEHRRRQGLRQNWARVQREAQALASVGVRSHPDLSSALRGWWGDLAYNSTSRPPWQRRLSPHRLVEHLATWAGERSARSAVPAGPGGGTPPGPSPSSGPGPRGPATSDTGSTS